MRSEDVNSARGRRRRGRTSISRSTASSGDRHGRRSLLPASRNAPRRPARPGAHAFPLLLSPVAPVYRVQHGPAHGPDIAPAVEAFTCTQATTACWPQPPAAAPTRAASPRESSGSVPKSCASHPFDRPAAVKASRARACCSFHARATRPADLSRVSLRLDAFARARSSARRGSQGGAGRLTFLPAFPSSSSSCAAAGDHLPLHLVCLRTDTCPTRPRFAIVSDPRVARASCLRPVAVMRCPVARCRRRGGPARTRRPAPPRPASVARRWTALPCELHGLSILFAHECALH
ncbi:hypothetical protein DMC30DRAFT_387571 [Rhodotorula diobovata]|uniref:Uncharacterized protein n=1 Tax=Rhodotorula diobovata TaxID=5288 RepID=A0A5C5G509_9BASI|nr:hypothetical protein DMC30DRAFT_387571 [Rhodotorula diobovata]